MDHDRLIGLLLVGVCGAAAYWCLDRVLYAVHHRGFGVLVDRRAYLLGEGRRRPKSGLAALFATLYAIVGLAAGWVLVFAPRTERTLHVTALYVTSGRHTDYDVVAGSVTWHAPQSIYTTLSVGGVYRCHVLAFAFVHDIEHCP